VPEVKHIALRKRGCPLTKVQAYIMALRKAGTPVNLNIVLAAAEQWRWKIVEFGGLEQGGVQRFHVSAPLILNCLLQ